jgi:hypothetical protein
MMSRNHRALWTTVGSAALLLLAALIPAGGCRKEAAPQPTPPAPATRSAATSTTAPATTRAASTEPLPPRSFAQLVKLAYPESAATQPLDYPLDRKDGARVVLREPILLDRLTGNLWITRPDAEPAEIVLARAGKETEHFVRDRPAYVHWRYEPPTDRKHPGRSVAVLVCPVEGDRESIEFVEYNRRTRLTGERAGYHWEDAFSRDDEIVVASSTGASVFTRTETGWTENASPPLIEDSTPHATPQVPLAIDSLLAYVPAEGRHPGSKSVARYVDGKWTLLGEAQRWPGNFLHLIPLSDGRVLQLILGDEEKVRLAIADFANVKVDRRHVLELLAALEDKDREKRDAAFRELSTYGTGLWPILEAEMDNQPPAVREKMAELLKNKTNPTLGEMELVDSQLKLVARTHDGGALLYTKGGVAVINVDGDQTLAAPAWISARSGQPIRLMLGPVWNDLTPNNKQFYALGAADWVVSDEGAGPQQIVGTFELEPILRRSEIPFRAFVGTDRRGRWLFRRPPEQGKPASRQTLVLDPTLPPVKPRLPVWDFAAVATMAQQNGGNNNGPPVGVTPTVGCDDQDFPAYQDRGGNVWIIGENGFMLMGRRSGDHYITEAGAIAKRTRRYAVNKEGVLAPATQPAGLGTHAVVSAEAELPLLLLDDGTRYFGGKTELRLVDRTGHEVNWPLPPEAQGSAVPWLVPDRDGRLFLFNEPGRLLRIRPTPARADEPFKLEATFSHKIPNVELRRMWLDPAGRIVMAYSDDRLAICFPGGIIPQAIAEKMPATERDDEDQDQ